MVHCGIEPARFGEIQPLPTSGTRLVAIGRLVEQKGQLLLVQAMARATRTHPDLHLTLVGMVKCGARSNRSSRRSGLKRISL